MLRSEPIIAVRDVEASASWYMELLGCNRSHRGPLFEILTDEAGEQLLSLHRWDAHDHPTFKNPEIAPGNGLILYFVVDDLEKTWKNAEELKTKVEARPHLNTNSGRMEFSLRDPDGYFISVCSDN
ncbi:VOC family protein [Zeaxanthinibacter sp. PT1]|uniref:VOC family protein n=1 Tax=Zeaxanthinibacter TaxID=561554 RepID=UPI00234B9368|nr:VOC family protein [Zeaxanthinibacter sp. PT1]MDC6350951.1 VOC family protein [Zeaxanthinibacter sp. PT1]